MEDNGATTKTLHTNSTNVCCEMAAHFAKKKGAGSRVLEMWLRFGLSLQPTAQDVEMFGLAF